MIQMKDENKQMNQKLYQNKDNDSKNHLDQQNQLESLKNEVLTKTFEIQEIKKNLKNMESNQITQRQALKEAEDKLGKYDNFYLPRLRDTRKYQKELSDNIE